MKRLILNISIIVCLSNTVSTAQNFINCDLDGPPITTSSILPYSWQAIPHTDINCIANYLHEATPDLTDQFGPSSNFRGNPYSGTTFVSGLHGSGYHEGIKQTVSGFCIGCSYSVNFFQSVVKQTSHIDSSGSWSVYVDNTLAGVTVPTISYAAIASNIFTWHFRNINFIATSTTHTIKFLPTDNDPLFTHPYGVRMGIDSIYITSITNLPVKLVSFSATLNKNVVNLNWATSSEINNDYFTIERSDDAIDWDELKIIQGAGNSTMYNTYENIDYKPLNGISYYRLKQTDFDGNFSYSNIVSANKKISVDIYIYPNPATDFVIVELNESSNVRLTLYNMYNEIKAYNYAKSDIHIIHTAELPKGNYILFVEQEGVLIRREKIIVQ